jgi:glycosyltransferase involved in cell wall biosynthesis
LSAVLLSHPHVVPVSAGVAGALGRAGRLSCFATGVSFNDATLGRAVGDRLAAWRPVIRNRIVSDVPPGKLRAHPLVELGARGAARVLEPLFPSLNTYNTLFAAHDAAVAADRWPRETTAIYAYEDGALWTFRRAARKGLERVWDLPLPHYATIEKVWADERARWPGAVDTAPHIEPHWKRARKDKELALATKVSVASAFTKQSLEGENLRVPVVVAPYGFPTTQFDARSTRPSGPFVVLAVSSHDLRKGTPYLLEAWKRAAIPDAELRLVGRMRLTKSFLDGYAGLFRYWPHVPRSQLRERYAAADVLAFPTLGDGFGIVIQEAMCTGVPVITTPCGGGPECITDGVDGWIIPPRDIDALVERLRACAADRDHTLAVGRTARARAERFTWNEAGEGLLRSLDLS